MKDLLLLVVLLFTTVLFSCSNQDNTASEANASDNTIQSVLADSSKYTTVRWLDSIKDFGTIKMGQKVKITFRCKNTGEKPLYLSDVRPSCGCTLAEYTKEPILPNKEGIITAEFDSNKSHPGKVRKTIYVRTNTKNDTPPYLVFTGQVQRADSSQAVSKTH